MNKGVAVGIGVGIAIIFVVVAFATNQIPSDENGALDSQEPDVQTTPTTEPGKTFTLELSDGAGTTDGTP